MRHSTITEKIIGAAYKVHNALGRGFLEKVYENALAAEMSDSGLQVQQQCPVPVRYKGRIIGDYVTWSWKAR